MDVFLKTDHFSIFSLFSQNLIFFFDRLLNKINEKINKENLYNFFSQKLMTRAFKKLFTILLFRKKVIAYTLSNFYRDFEKKHFWPG